MNDLDIEEFNEAVIAMNVLDADQKMWELRVIQFPNTKQPSQERLIKDLRKISDQSLRSQSTGVISNEQLAKILAQR